MIDVLNSFGFWAALALTLAALQLPYFVYLPAVADRLERQGNRAGARRLLALIAGTPSLLGVGMKLNALYRLATLTLSQGDYSGAVREFRRLTALIGRLGKGFPKGLEYEIRSKLALSLEKSGNETEANEERERAEAALENAPSSPMTLVARGRLHSSRFEWAEAVSSFEKSLATRESWTPDARTEVLAQLANAAYNAGRCDECIRWAEEAIDQDPTQPFLREMAHVTAALGHSAQGNLDEAERHRANALALATNSDGVSSALAEERRDRAASYRVQLADLVRRRGKIVEAERVVAEVLASLPPHQSGDKTARAGRDGLAVRYELLRTQGHFADALATLAQIGALPAPSKKVEGRYAAALALSGAITHAESGAPGSLDLAQALLSDAQNAIGRDPRLSVARLSVSLWVNALQGKRSAVAALLSQVEGQMPLFERDRETRLTCLVRVALAHLALGDGPRARVRLEEALEKGRLDPVSLPAAYFQMGESYRIEGANEAATEWYRKAIALDIETHYARLAREGLASVSAAPALPDASPQP